MAAQYCEEFTPLEFRFVAPLPLLPATCHISRRHGVHLMAIVIIQGPHSTTQSISDEVLEHLKQLTRAAGRTLELCTCGGLRDFMARVRATKFQATEFVLLDPADLTPQLYTDADEGLGEALDGMTTPYVEVHGGRSVALESRDCAHGARMATIIVNGDLATSYQIALGVALRRLGAMC